MNGADACSKGHGLVLFTMSRCTSNPVSHHILSIQPHAYALRYGERSVGPRVISAPVVYPRIDQVGTSHILCDLARLISCQTLLHAKDVQLLFYRRKQTTPDHLRRYVFTRLS